MRKSVYAGKNLFQLEKIFSSREKQVFVVPVLNLSNMSMREKESKRKKYFPTEKNIVVPVLKFSNMSMREKQSKKKKYFPTEKML